MLSTFFEGLLYLDLLEIYGSSSLVGELYFLSQSNVYRAAMSLSAALPSLGGGSGGVLAYHEQRGLNVVDNLKTSQSYLSGR